MSQGNILAHLTFVSPGEHIVDIILGVEAGFEPWVKIWLV